MPNDEREREEGWRAERGATPASCPVKRLFESHPLQLLGTAKMVSEPPSSVYCASSL
jgi:hypothetical protein